MSGPSAAVIASLAPRWESVSVHEAGHAVIGCLLGIPISHLTLTYERSGLFQWAVRGRTEVVGGSIEAEDREIVLFFLAGLEAEALHIAATTGADLDRVRAEVQSRHANQDDVQEITLSLPGSGYTPDQAVAEVNDLLHEHWQAVTYLATALGEQGYLPGTAVADLV